MSGNLLIGWKFKSDIVQKENKYVKIDGGTREHSKSSKEELLKE